MKAFINAHLSSTCMHFQPLHICFECCTFTLTRVRLLNALYGSKSGHLSQGSTLPCRLSHRWLDEAQLSWGHTPDRWSSINHRCAACKLFPSGSLSTRSAACQRVTGANSPKAAAAAAAEEQFYSHRKWDVPVCDSVVSVGSDLLLGLSFSPPP